MEGAESVRDGWYPSCLGERSVELRAANGSYWASVLCMRHNVMNAMQNSNKWPRTELQISSIFSCGRELDGSDSIEIPIQQTRLVTAPRLPC